MEVPTVPKTSSDPRRLTPARLLLCGLLLASQAQAIPTQVTHNDSASCDPLVIPAQVEEVGTAPGFSGAPASLIAASSSVTAQTACTLFPDDPGTPNLLVSITNTTGRAWASLWYVADTAGPGGGTLIANQDGFADDAVAGSGFGGGQAFAIDAVGVNTPLLSESAAPDGVFELGETWDFVIQDYLNFAGDPADAFSSIGVGTASPGSPSSGSIIGIPLAVPEPGGASLLAFGLVALGIRCLHPLRDRPGS